MKLSLSTAELLAQLQTVTRVASTRSAVQALSGVMISAEEAHRPSCWRPTWRSACGCRSQAEVARPGSVVLPARLLLEVVRARCRRPNVTLELRTAEQDVELISGPAHVPPAHAARRGLPDAARALDAETRVSLPAEAFVADGHARRALGLADETRPVLTGILMSAAGPGAADGGHRLLPPERQADGARVGRWRARSRRTSRRARCRSWRGSPNRPPSAESSPSASGQNQVVFELGDVVLSSRLIDGQFPNYRQLLPESVEHELRLATRRARPTSCAASACSRRRTRRCA